MRIRHHLAALLAALLACAAAQADSIPAPTPAATVATRGIEVFAWDLAQKLHGFRNMETLFPASVAPGDPQASPLPVGAPLPGVEAGDALGRWIDSFMAEEYVAGLLVLHRGEVRLERYGLGFSPAERWTSFSVAKSVTSTLVGAAIADGYIGSLDDDISKYLIELRDTSYEGVTIRQLLTMTSGVAFNEDYSDPDSDIMQLYGQPPPPDIDATVAFVRRLEREAEPGTLWRYKTPETNLAGALVIAATGRSLSQYLSEKIWQPYGMERDATWLVDHVGNEQGGCCLQVALRDYARFAQFILEGAAINGRSIVPEGWLGEATRSQADTGMPGGYGFQWWPLGDGTFQARGIFGQLIHLDPARELVVVISAAWPGPREQQRRMAQIALVREIAAALDDESAVD
jgi:CubicO group peptidase (beta-lactamase class C family)